MHCFKIKREFHQLAGGNVIRNTLREVNILLQRRYAYLTKFLKYYTVMPKARVLNKPLHVGSKEKTFEKLGQGYMKL